MGFSAIGIVMLVVVLIFYLRMVDARASSRQRKAQVQSIIEKAEVFESVAKDKDAIKVIEQGLQQYPENERLQQKLAALKQR